MPTMSSLRNTRSLFRTKRAGTWPASVTIRAAVAADAEALRRLAVLDDHAPITGEALVAEVGGELWAAAAVEDAAVIADPFRPSGELALLLAERAGAMRRARQRATRGRRLLRPARLAA
jgi:hypothetical protein